MQMARKRSIARRAHLLPVALQWVENNSPRKPMTSNRKKPGVAGWVTVAVVAVLVGYPLSFEPACWLSKQSFDTVRSQAELGN